MLKLNQRFFKLNFSPWPIFTSFNISHITSVFKSYSTTKSLEENPVNLENSGNQDNQGNQGNQGNPNNPNNSDNPVNENPGKKGLPNPRNINQGRSESANKVAVTEEGKSAVNDINGLSNKGLNPNSKHGIHVH